MVSPGQTIPSSNGAAIANALGTDIGNVGRNVLRGPNQNNIEFRAEVFNLLNHVNLSNPISDLNAVSSTGSFDPASGRIVNPGDFGRITSTSNNPRFLQFAIKFNY